MLALGAVFLVLAVAAAAITAFHGGGLGPIEALRAAGQPVCLADLAREPISDKENGATYVNLAERELSQVGREVAAAVDKLPEAEKEAWIADDDSIPQMIDDLRTICAAHPAAFDLLEQAANCPDYEPTRDGVGTFFSDEKPDYSTVRSAARLLRYRTAVLIADRRLDEALHSCVIGLRLARHQSRHGVGLDQLVSFACMFMAIQDVQRVFDAVAVSPAAMAELEAALSDFAILDDFRRWLPRDRATMLQTLQEHNQASTLNSLKSWLRGDVFTYLDAYEQAIAVAELPTWQWQDEYHFVYVPGRFGAMDDELLPNLDRLLPAVVSAEAMVRAARVFNAIQSREQAGDLPAPVELGKLGLPAEATIDPFTGEPLHIKKTDRKWVVYSVGSNRVDDGGVTDSTLRRPDVGFNLTLLPDPGASVTAGPAE